MGYRSNFHAAASLLRWLADFFEGAVCRRISFLSGRAQLYEERRAVDSTTITLRGLRFLIDLDGCPVSAHLDDLADEALAADAHDVVPLASCIPDATTSAPIP